jgi:hypothetical protein
LRDYTTFSATIGVGRAGGVRVKLREDKCAGKTYIEAARSYLERIGHAVSMEELLDAFKNGSSPVGGRALSDGQPATQIKASPAARLWGG